MNCGCLHVLFSSWFRVGIIDMVVCCLHLCCSWLPVFRWFWGWFVIAWLGWFALTDIFGFDFGEYFRLSWCIVFRFIVSWLLSLTLGFVSLLVAFVYLWLFLCVYLCGFDLFGMIVLVFYIVSCLYCVMVFLGRDVCFVVEICWFFVCLFDCSLCWLYVGALIVFFTYDDCWVFTFGCCYCRFVYVFVFELFSCHYWYVLRCVLVLVYCGFGLCDLLPLFPCGCLLALCLVCLLLVLCCLWSFEFRVYYCLVGFSVDCVVLFDYWLWFTDYCCLLLLLGTWFCVACVAFLLWYFACCSLRLHFSAVLHLECWVLQVRRWFDVLNLLCWSGLLHFGYFGCFELRACFRLGWFDFFLDWFVFDVDMVLLN